MSAPGSPALPRSVSEGADRQRWLSSRASAEPGRFRTARAPDMREIMDRLAHGADSGGGLGGVMEALAVV